MDYPKVILPLRFCGWPDALLPKAKGNSVLSHPQHLGGDSSDCCKEGYEIIILLPHSAARQLYRSGPPGIWPSLENVYLFSGSWAALIIVFGELGSKLIVLEI